ncbi:hypothetical protein KKA95_02225 [Patescibacteria group bacterium]|nr:hypothetical protein [Patescibacteria group bacterium]
MILRKKNNIFFPKWKKATSTLMIIFELVIVSLVIFGTVRIAHAYGNSLITQKVNIAEDVRMMVNTLVGVPGDAIVKYPHDVSNFRLILNQDGVSVFNEGDSQFEYTKRTFYLPTGYSAAGSMDGEEYFCLDKQDRTIILRACLENEP